MHVGVRARLSLSNPGSCRVCRLRFVSSFRPRMRWHATRSGAYKRIIGLWRVTPLLGGAGREAALLAVARNRWLWVSQMYERRHFGAAGIHVCRKLLSSAIHNQKSQVCGRSQLIVVARRRRIVVLDRQGPSKGCLAAR